MSEESLIEFPAEIAVKAMGLNEDNFEALVSGLVNPLVHPQETGISTRESSGGKYLSVRVHFVAQDLDQLHRIYSALRAEPRVLYLL